MPRHPIDRAILGAVVLALAVLYLRSVFKWWYEDDPLQFYFAAQINNPLRIFFDRSVLGAFGTGKALVPMQVLSYWIDVKIAGFSPGFAYAHSLLAWLATTWIFHALLLRWIAGTLGARRISFGTTIFWLLLPSTLVVHQFLATRHYMEGLFFALAAIYLVMGDPGSEKPLAARLFSPRMAAVILLAAAAMLCKEIFVPTLLTFLFLVGLGRRRYEWSVVAVALALAYTLYRLWLVGPGLEYTMPYLGPEEYVHFLGLWPFMLAANWGGLLIYAAVAGLIALSLLFPQRGSRRTTFLMGGIAAASFAAIYPVSYAIPVEYWLPRPWYRVPFVFHTLLVAWGGYLAARYLTPRQQALVWVVALAIVLPGTEWTRQLWNESMARAKTEADYYLANPKRLLLSEEPFWFLYGISEMYGEPRPHFIVADEPETEHASRMIVGYSTIWRYQDSAYVQDDKLYRAIRRRLGCAFAYAGPSGARPCLVR